MRLLLLVILLFQTSIVSAQSAKPETKCQNPDFEKTVNKYLSYSVPILTVDQLKKNKEGYIVLDAREREEFEVSHIPGAKYVGYDDFDIKRLSTLPKDKPIVVYCSIGYRSEKVAEKLQKAGYENVYNLFGSLFEWANRSYELQDLNGKSTNKIHTYNKKWGKWMENSKLQKVH